MIVLIYTPSFDENSGGSIVLHRLCHLINQYTEHKSFLVKMDPSTCGRFSFIKVLSKIKWNLYSQFKFITNTHWNTPIWNKKDIPNECIVIYPEVVSGNPLHARNIVRWLLHQPGFHNGVINFSTNELYFKFNSAIDDFNNEGSTTSVNELKVIYYPIDIYNINGEQHNRNIDVCYLVRKGGNKPPVHDIDAIQIDGLSHKEIAEIFNKSKKFICYDDYTAYSIFAVLCGCKSYVVPEAGKSIVEWYPDESDRYGISYGFDLEQELWAESTSHKVLEHIAAEHEKSTQNVIVCLNEMREFFNITAT
jgi:hypothetical protein